MTDERTRVALVSGGSRGIGRATVLRLAKDGFAVSFCYRADERAAGELEKEVSELGARVLAVRADVGDAETVKAWVSRTEEELGAIDVAVTSAGIVRDKPLLTMSREDWHDVLDTNLDGVYHVCHAAVFGMLKRKRAAWSRCPRCRGSTAMPSRSTTPPRRRASSAFRRRWPRKSAATASGSTWSRPASSKRT